jgi:L-ascorbate metabolism protein UlaG (beta-lactamase superfamily)
MNKFNCKVYYIYHSCFAIETPSHLLVFDYYKEPNKFILKDLIRNKHSVLVFSSHNHEDHFNPEILDWEKYNPNIKYILSSDITLEEWKSNFHKLSQEETLIFEKESNNKLENIEIKAYGSTDIGISFLVKVDGLNIFHAGDLNWWHWKEDSVEERKSAEQNFKKEISKIKGEQIDIAFFPVDPRLEEFYSLGAEYFIKEIDPKTLIPMHFGDNLYITKELSEKFAELPVKIVTINNSAEELRL